MRKIACDLLEVDATGFIRAQRCRWQLVIGGSLHISGKMVGGARIPRGRRR
jgi:hypothetical protein